MIKPLVSSIRKSIVDSVDYWDWLWGTQSITTMFTNGEQGVWYDPNDLTTDKLNWRRNKLTYSESFDNAIWIKPAVTIVPNDAVSPIGTLTADKMTGSGTFTFPLTQATPTVVGTAYTHSVYVKAAGLDFIQLAGSTGFTSTEYVNFDLQAGAVTFNSGSIPAEIVSVGSGWFRCSITLVAVSGTSGQIAVFLINSAGAPRGQSFTNDGVSGVHLWGAQFELGAKTEYQKITDFDSEFKTAFPSHTLYQDILGNTPVTAAGQPVGLMLDKRLGLVRGSELVNTVVGPLGDNRITRGTGVPAAGGYWEITTTSVVSGAYGAIVSTSDNALPVGMVYELVVDVLSISSSTPLLFRYGTSHNLGVGSPPDLLSITSPGVYTRVIRSESNDCVNAGLGINTIATVGDTVTFKASIRPIPGNHAFQSTAASRPTLRQTPILSPTDKLTNGEFTTDTIWIKGADWSIAGGKATRVSGTASNLVQIGTYTSGKEYIVTFVVSGYVSGTVTPVLAGGTAVVGGAVSANGTYTQKLTSTGNTEFRLTANATGAYSIESVSVLEVTGYYIDRNYLETDGVDDWMSTNPIDFTGTDKVSVFAGVRKLSDAVTGTIVELSASSSTTPGTFGILTANAANSFEFRSTGGNAIARATGTPLYPAKSSVVAAGIGDISGDVSALRLNGAQVSSNSGDQGTGNYGSHPLYLFRRGGTSLPFTGHFYGLIIVGRLTTFNETKSIELMLAKSTGVTIV